MRTRLTTILAGLVLATASLPLLADDDSSILLPWWEESSPVSGMPTTPGRPLPDSGGDSARPLLSVSLMDPDATALIDSRHAAWNGWLDRRFMLSMDRWETPDASQAHIRCDGGTRRQHGYRAENCRFVAEPAANQSLDLMRIGGEWLATPDLSVGMGVFRGIGNTPGFGFEATETTSPWQRPAEGIDLSLSLGLDAGRVGDLLVDLQLARFREDDPGELPGLSGYDSNWRLLEPRQAYNSAAQLSLGWRKGDFSGGIQGQFREMPAWWLNATGQESFRSFDIEFSWRAPWNASFSIGASNFLDNQPDGELASDPATTAADPMEGIYGRIPYVRYKQDL